MTRFPGFTAEACATGAGAPVGRGYRTPGGSAASAAVSPQWRRARASGHTTVVTCEPGSTVCDDFCQHAGGGMSSNPDGSTTCTVYS